MNDREPPGYDDWFDEPEPPTLEQGRAGRQAYDAPSGTEEDVWTLPEDEPRSRRPQRGGNVGGLTTTQIAIIAIAGVAIIIAIIAAFGGFNSGTPASAPPTVNTGTTKLPTTTQTSTTVTVTLPTQTGLQNGSTGPQVKLLQHALIDLGYLNPPADGDFGATTESAVKTFQTASGLTADGVVGQQTLAALKTAVNNKG